MPFVNITPQMRRDILRRIRSVQLRVLGDLASEGLITQQEADTETTRILVEGTPASTTTEVKPL